MLYRVDPFDRLALVTAALVVGSSAAAACLLPARRAARVDPMIALPRGITAEHANRAHSFCPVRRAVSPETARG
jgi:hypothetical protein